MTLKVLVVDDSIVMRALFEEVFQQADGIDCVGAARNAAEARQMIAQHNPDVVTLDVEMPKVSGLELLAELMAETPLPVVMLSTRMEGEAAPDREKAMALGAAACFAKPKGTRTEFAAVVDDLCGTIREAAQDMSGEPQAARPA